MTTLNKIQLIGYLGKDPQLRYTLSSKEVCDISVATTSSWIGGDGQTYETINWITVTCWGQLALNVCQHLKKGSKVYIEGRKHTNILGKGVKRKYYTTFVASQVINLDQQIGRTAESAMTDGL